MPSLDEIMQEFKTKESADNPSQSLADVFTSLGIKTPEEELRMLEEEEQRRKEEEERQKAMAKKQVIQKTPFEPQTPHEQFLGAQTSSRFHEQEKAPTSWEDKTVGQKIHATIVEMQNNPLVQQSQAYQEGLFGAAGIKDIPFAGTVKETVDLVQIGEAYRSVSQGEGTDQQKEILRNFYEIEDELAEKREDIGYIAGETVRGSAKFMAELAPVALTEFFSVGIAPTGEMYAGSKIAQKGAVKVVKEILKDKVVRNQVVDVAKEVSKKKLKTFGKQMLVSGSVNIPHGTAERMIGRVDLDTGEILDEGQDIDKAIVNSTTGLAVELVSELGGGVTGKALSTVASPAKKVLVKSSIYNAIKKKIPTATDNQITKVLEKTGWNGVMGEFFEERDADILNNALHDVGLGDQDFTGVTLRDIATEFLAFGSMGVGVKAIPEKKKTSDEKVRQSMAEKDYKAAQKEIDNISLEDMRVMKADMDEIGDMDASSLVMKEMETRSQEVDTLTKKAMHAGDIEVIAEASPQVRSDVVKNLEEIAPQNEQAAAVIPSIETKREEQKKVQADVKELQTEIAKGGINAKTLKIKEKQLAEKLDVVYDIKDFREAEAEEVRKVVEAEVGKERAAQAFAKAKEEDKTMPKEERAKYAAIVKTEAKPVAERTSQELISGEQGGNVWMEMDAAEAGERIYREEDPASREKGPTFQAKKSTFPQWISSDLRDRTLFNKVQEHMQKGTEPTSSRQKRLYDEIVSEIRKRETQQEETGVKYQRSAKYYQARESIQQLQRQLAKVPETDKKQQKFLLKQIQKLENEQQKFQKKVPKEETDVAKSTMSDFISPEEAMKQFEAFGFIDGITIEMVREIAGGEAYGSYAPLQELVRFVNNPHKTTIPHEMFHAFHNAVATPEQQNKSIEMIKKQYPQEVARVQKQQELSENAAAEEVLAEKFAEMFVADKHPKTKIGRYLKWLSSKLKEIVSNVDEINKLYTQVLNPMNTTQAQKRVRTELQRRGISTPIYQSIADDINTKNLVVAHNISAENLDKTFEASGLPAPSLAILKKGHRFTNYGDITLVGTSNIIDPEKGARTFAGDVYSPRFPTVYTYKNESYAREMKHRFADDFASVDESAGYGSFETNLTNDTATLSSLVHDAQYMNGLKASFIREHGQTPIITKQKKIDTYSGKHYKTDIMKDRIKSGETFRRSEDPIGVYPDKTYEDINTMVEQMVDNLSERNLRPEIIEDYREVYRAQFFGPDGTLNFGPVDSMDNFIVKLHRDPETLDIEKTTKALDKQIKSLGDIDAYNDWIQEEFAPVYGETYIESGGKKIPATEDNVIKQMLKATRTQEESMFTGLAKIKSMLIKEFKNVEQIKRAKGAISPEQEDLNDKFHALAEDLAQEVKESDRYDSFDSENLAQIVFNVYKKSKTGIGLEQEIKSAGYPNATDEQIQSVRDFMEELKALPVGYFESVPQRIVPLSEFTHAIVPKNTPKEIKDGLRERGVTVRIYQDTDSRTVIRDQVAEMFQMKGQAIPVVHGGPKDLVSNKLKFGMGVSGDMGAIFFAEDTETGRIYADNYTLKHQDGKIYEAVIKPGTNIFNINSEADIKQLNAQQEIIDDMKNTSTNGAVDWSTGSQYFDIIEEAGFDGIKLIERPKGTPMFTRKTGKVEPLPEDAISYAIFNEDAFDMVVEDNGLAQEAKKYKTADEFVKSQGMPVYHRSQNKFYKFDISKVSNDSNRQRYGWGIYFSDTIPHDQYGKHLYKAQFTKGTLIDTKKSVDEKIVSKIVEGVKENNKNPSELVEFSYNGYLFYKTLSRILGGDKNASLFLSKNGIDGLKSNTSKNTNDYILFNDKSIKTKQQLIDIWNKAQKQKTNKKIIAEQVKFQKKVLKTADTIIKSGEGKTITQRAEEIANLRVQLSLARADGNQKKVEAINSKLDAVTPEMTADDRVLIKAHEIIYAIRTKEKYDAFVKKEKEKRKKQRAKTDETIKVFMDNEREMRGRIREMYKKKLSEQEKAANVVRERRVIVSMMSQQFALSDKSLRDIGGKRDVRFMTDEEFNSFIKAMLPQAIKEQKLMEKRAEIIDDIQARDLRRTENLQKALDLPPIKDMNMNQLKKFEEGLAELQEHDVLLTQRQLETIKNTDIWDIKTMREAREKFAEDAGVPFNPEMRMTTGWTERFLYDTALAEKHPFFNVMVSETAKEMLISDSNYLLVEKRTEELLQKARNSRPRTLMERIAPTDERIFAYLESENKAEASETMTNEEIQAALFIQKQYAQMRDYLIENEMMDRYITDYITHIHKGFFETWKGDGFIEAVKNTIVQVKEDRASFEILSNTGEILPLEKFFQFSMRRTGGMDASKNVGKAFLAYKQTFERKRALDSVMPKLDAYVSALTPEIYTQTGLEMDRSLKRFFNTWMNNKKGRRTDFAGFLPQGGAIDNTLRVIRMITTMIDLGGSLATGAAAQVGEQATTYTMLGAQDYAKGTARAVTPQGRKIAKEYENFIGKTLFDDLKDVSSTAGQKFQAAMFGMFRNAQRNANKQYLMASLTEEEFESGEVSAERLAQIQKDMGRWRVVDNSNSVFGATSAGKLFMQYKGWAVPILRTSANNIYQIYQYPKKLNQREGQELLRISLVTTVFVLAGMYALDDEDDSAIGQLTAKMVREGMSLLGALDPELWTRNLRTLEFLRQLGVTLKQLATLEEYKAGKEGEYEKGDLKGIRTLERTITPKAIKQLMD